jgi:phosphoglycolate phosphatase
MNIFFDLDGTLIDSRTRLYRLFQYLVPTSNLSFDEYWLLKRNKINHFEILTNKFGYTEQAFKVFEQKWLNEIEQPKWLHFDVPFNGVTELLANLSSTHKLYLVTARQFESEVLKQITNFGWEHFFSKIFVTAQTKEKHELISDNIVVSPDDWFVGDTGMDVQTGKKLGIKTVAVLSGFLNKENLLSYKPDFIINDVTCLTFN